MVAHVFIYLGVVFSLLDVWQGKHRPPAEVPAAPEVKPPPDALTQFVRAGVSPPQSLRTGEGADSETAITPTVPSSDGQTGQHGQPGFGGGLSASASASGGSCSPAGGRPVRH